MLTTVPHQDDSTDVYNAVRAQAIDTVQALLNSGADSNSLDIHGNSLLYHAIQDARVDIIQALLAKGANPNILDVNGKLPLWHAARNRERNIVQILLTAGADLNDAIDEYNRRFLFTQAIQRDLISETPIHLLEENSEENFRSLLDNLPPLTLQKYLFIISKLAQDNLKIKLFVTKLIDLRQWEPIALAIEKNLISLDFKSRSGNTLLHEAVNATDKNAFKRFFRLGIEATMQNEANKTPHDIASPNMKRYIQPLTMQTQKIAEQFYFEHQVQATNWLNLSIEEKRFLVRWINTKDPFKALPNEIKLNIAEYVLGTPLKLNSAASIYSFLPQKQPSSLQEPEMLPLRARP